MLNLPEKARLGTAFADVSFFAGENAEALSKSLDKAYFEKAWADCGFVNATLTDKALLSLYGEPSFGKIRVIPEELTEEELFSPAVYAYLTLLPRANAAGIPSCPEWTGERRRLFLRLAAAARGGFSLSEELSLCQKVMNEAVSSFLTGGEDEGLKMLCSAAVALLEKRIDGGF